MGMGYDGYFSVVVEEEYIERLSLTSYRLFKIIMDKLEEELGEYDFFAILGMGSVTGYDDISDARLHNLVKSWENFQKEFEVKTGMDIMLNYHNSEDYGDRYDEVEGLFFELDFRQVYQLSTEAKELMKSVPFGIRNYVHYG